MVFIIVVKIIEVVVCFGCEEVLNLENKSFVLLVYINEVCVLVGIFFND